MQYETVALKCYSFLFPVMAQLTDKENKSRSTYTNW